MFENEGQEETQPVESPVESPAPETTPEATPQAPQVTDIDSLEKFKFAGREMTPKELQAQIMMQSDYTRKTQEIAKERTYYENLRFDLAKVKQNPALAKEFKSIYPQNFHDYLEYVTPAQKAQAQAQQQQYAQIDPNVMQRFERIEADMNNRSVAAINAELDAKFKTLSEKYPSADEESCIARAIALTDKKVQLTDQVWDGIFKSVHDKSDARYKAMYSAQVNKQKQANSKGKDSASGGGIPGNAPVRPKSIKEASRLALEEMENS